MRQQMPFPEPAPFTFGLELDGVLTAYAQRVSGIMVEIEASPVSDTSGTIPAEQPGTVSLPDITLSRVFATGTEILAWRKHVDAGNAREAHKNGSILLFDPTGTVLAQWNFTSGWPSSYTVASNEHGDEFTEELTIAHAGIQRIT